MCTVLFLSTLEKNIIFLSISVLASGQGWEIRAVSRLCPLSSPGTGRGLPLQKQQLNSGPPRHVGVILGIISATLSTEYPLQEIQVCGEVQAEPGTSERLLSSKNVDLHIYTCEGNFTFPARFTQPLIPEHLPGKVVGLCRLFSSCQAF